MTLLGESVATALPILRAHAESLMVDSCTVVSVTAGAWDDATGTYPEVLTTVYDGPCRVRMANTAEHVADSGEASWTTQGVTVSLPVATSGAVALGHVLTVTACVWDEALVGQPFKVTGAHFQTHSTARRLRCEWVVRP